jgi:O-succinylbenzoic acid--CoA ligase
VAGGRTTTYAELEEEAATAARRVAALGVGPGDRVATTLPPGRELTVLLHALPKLGAAIALINTRLTAGERRAQLNKAGARTVIEDPPTGEEADVELRSTADPEGEWTLLFTSGTTGRPKPVALSHGNHAASALASAWNLGVAPDDRWLCVLPAFHVGGLAVLVRSAVYGTAAVVHPRFETEAARDVLAAGEATVTSLVPTMLGRLLDAGLERPPALRAALLGGAAAPRALLERAERAGIPVVRTYGMTETASQIATGAPGAPAIAARPLPGVELRIAPEGELLVRGPMVARGALSPDGWLHTGDRGRLDHAGALHVEGRMDQMIVTGGENVVALEVEEAIGSHPAVREVAVVGRPDPEWGEAVVAYVVAAADLDRRTVIAHCRDRLAPHKVPKSVELVVELPRSAAGKVDRKRLAATGGGRVPRP